MAICSSLMRYIVFRILGICLDILQNRWSPTYDVSAILTSIQSLLDEPNPNSPANSVAAQLYQENRREYEKRVAAIVESSWLNYPPDEDDGSGPSSGSGNDNSTSSNSGQTWDIIKVQEPYRTNWWYKVIYKLTISLQARFTLLLSIKNKLFKTKFIYLVMIYSWKVRLTINSTPPPYSIMFNGNPLIIEWYSNAIFCL